MPPVTIYTTPYCSYCFRAKKLLNGKGINFDEIDVAFSPELRTEMVKRAGGKQSVPQIFIGEQHIGGSDELHALDAKGELDPLLQK
jgi:glutaredoxin 3